MEECGSLCRLGCRSRRFTASQIKNNDLVIGTHGRSFYVMSNIGVLRQVSRETTNEAVVLFDPSDAIRSVSPAVTIDYYLKQPAENVTVEILDAADKTVRTFTGAPAPAGGTGGRAETPAGEDDEEGGGRGAAPPRVGVGIGHEPVHMGSALSRGSRLPWAHPLGGEHARARRPSWTVSGQAHGQRRLEDAGLRHHPQQQACRPLPTAISSSSSRSPSRSPTRSRSLTTPCCAFAASRIR